jgi:predicted ABC-type ATPase
MDKKEVTIIAGANGVGKTTWSGAFLADYPHYPFLNADNVVKEIAPGDPEGSAIAAGRIFLRRQSELIRQGRSFLLESTLSGRSLIKMIKNLRGEGNRVRIVFIFLDSPETLIGRIKNRVAKGGHHIPDDDVRRRFTRSGANVWMIIRASRGWRPKRRRYRLCEFA